MTFEISRGVTPEDKTGERIVVQASLRAILRRLQEAG